MTSCVLLEIVGGRKLKLLGQRGVLGGSLHALSLQLQSPCGRALPLELQMWFLSPCPLGLLQPAG